MSTGCQGTYYFGNCIFQNQFRKVDLKFQDESGILFGSVRKQYIIAAVARIFNI
jgi:hypothetical protein